MADEQAPILQGGPGQDTPAAPILEPAPQRDLTLRGKAYKVDPDLYEAIEGYRREINERDGRRGSELQSLRQTVEQLRTAVDASSKKPDAPAPTGPQPPDPTLAFTDPGRYQTELLAAIDARATQREAALKQQYEADKQAGTEAAARQRTWEQRLGQFYKDNPDLVGEEDLVDMIWQRNFTSIKDLSLDDGFSKVAELTRARILKSAGKVQEPADGKTVKLEGSRPRQQAGAAAPEPEKPGSLSALIRARQQRLRSVPKSKPE